MEVSTENAFFSYVKITQPPRKSSILALLIRHFIRGYLISLLPYWIHKKMFEISVFWQNTSITIISMGISANKNLKNYLWLFTTHSITNFIIWGHRVPVSCTITSEEASTVTIQVSDIQWDQKQCLLKC